MSLRRCSRTVIDIDIDDLDTERMLPGMSVKGVVHGPTLQDVLLVPRSSIRWHDDGPGVTLAGGSETTVEIASCNAHVCAVQGIEEGTQLSCAEVQE